MGSRSELHASALDGSEGRKRTGGARVLYQDSGSLCSGLPVQESSSTAVWGPHLKWFYHFLEPLPPLVNPALITSVVPPTVHDGELMEAVGRLAQEEGYDEGC